MLEECNAPKAAAATCVFDDVFFDWARLIRSCNDRIEMRWNLPAEIQNAMSIEARISSWNIGG